MVGADQRCRMGECLSAGRLQPPSHPFQSRFVRSVLRLWRSALTDGGSGALEFVDPRASAETNPMIWQQTDSRIRVLPHPGKMIIFPCWLYHYVNPYRGEKPRTSVAFNVVFGQDT